MFQKLFILFAIALQLGAVSSIRPDVKWWPHPDCYPCAVDMNR